MAKSCSNNAFLDRNVCFFNNTIIFVVADIKHLLIVTDSDYVVDAISQGNKLLHWLQNGWMRIGNKLVKEKEQFCDLILEMQGINLKWVEYSFISS